MNTPFRDLRTADFNSTVIWPGPRTLRIGDCDDISFSNSLFARKFDESVDREILRRLATDGGHTLQFRHLTLCPTSVNLLLTSVEMAVSFLRARPFTFYHKH